jgi:hypothetical protein
MEELTLIPTRYSTLQNVEASNIQIVVHKNKKKDVKIKPLSMEQLKDNKAEKKEMDMKKVRYEVFKFGMSGFKAEKKEEVKVALAIKLGAKPPKNKYCNYKEYKHKKEMQLKEQLEQQKLLAVGKTKTGKPSTKGKRKFVSKKKNTNNDGILNPYGKPGKVNCTILIKIVSGKNWAQIAVDDMLLNPFTSTQ